MIVIRGAITAENNLTEDILSSTTKLIKQVVAKNFLNSSEIIAFVFSVTQDLTQEYPAVAARALGYDDTPLFCVQEMNKENMLAKCIRLMVFVNRDQDKSTVSHCYLDGAKVLRKDLSD